MRAENTNWRHDHAGEGTMTSRATVDAAIKRVEEQITRFMHEAATAPAWQTRAYAETMIEMWRTRQLTLFDRYAAITGEQHPLAIDQVSKTVAYWSDRADTQITYLDKLDAEICEVRSHIQAVIQQRKATTASREQQAEAARLEAYWGRRWTTLLTEWKQHTQRDHPDRRPDREDP